MVRPQAAVVWRKLTRVTRRCIFCDIIERVESAFIVYENSHAIVFLDKHPINVGHVLVVPKYHVESFYELDEDSCLARCPIPGRRTAWRAAQLATPLSDAFASPGFVVR